MAGILDQNSRILDFVLTTAGRRRLAEDGNLDISFASFSDKGAYYAKMSKTGSVADDGSKRLYVEANSPQSDNLYFISGSDSEDVRVEVSSEQRSSDLSRRLSNLSILLTRPDSRSSEQFEFSTSGFDMSFVPEIGDLEQSVTSDVSNMSAIFQDKRFQHFDNYKFLPPINSISGRPLGNFTKLNAEEIVTPAQLEEELQQKKNFKKTFEGDVSPTNITFRILETETSTSGDNLGEKIASTPLQLVDYGNYSLSDGSRKRVFFAGKILEDVEGIPVFVNMFTVVFDD
jgi:hypothetical protein